MNSQTDELLTLKEVSSFLKIHPNTLRLWDKDGTLTALRIGNKNIMRYRRADVMRLLEKSANQTANGFLHNLPPGFFYITDRVPAMIVIYNINTGKYVYVNETVKQLLGYDPEELISRGIAFVSSLIHPDDQEELFNKNAQALQVANQPQSATNTSLPIVSFEYRMKHKSGRWVWLRTDGSVFARGENNQVEYLMNVTIDITERKEQENKTRREIEAINYALDQSAIVAVTDKSGMIEYVNEKFIEISKYARDELVGKTHRVINSNYHPKAFFADMWQTILAGKVWRGEIRNQAKDGSYYWVDTTITPMLDENGKPNQFIAIRHDITPRKKLERQKDEFIGIASHELKTPVTSLKGYIQVMQRRFTKKGDHTSADFMAKMDAQVNKLTTLIQDLLDVTKIETGKLQFKLEKFDLSELVLETIETINLTTHRHTIEFSGTVTQLVYGDRERIGQVITNFLTNAIKYSPYSEEIKVMVSETSREATVAVQDFGVGILEENQQKIFERFFRETGAKEDTYPGLGLGLFICAELIKRHGGRIWVESQKGTGSTFCFTLPYNNQQIINQQNILAEEELKHE